MKDYEILAPAGNSAALIAAVNSGADAVYFGLDKFNARMKADNFTAENLSYWVDYCHLYGVKTYVTLNTSLKDEEFPEAVELLHKIYNANSDGVILTDLALLQYAGETFANANFHICASTQLNIHDAYGAAFVKNLGADTVVLARETPYQKIREISSAVSVRLEGFLHGANCVCQSGQCLLSSISGGKSGNRGLCAQPCRKFYSCSAEGTIKRGYLLSPKDICGLDFAKKLYDAGVRTFKIEGRNRRAEYAGETSFVYGKLFNSGFRAEKGDLSRLKRVYNRGNFVGDAYLSGKNYGIIYPLAQGHIGEKVGIVKNGKLVAAEAAEKGDCYKIFRAGREVGSAMALESGRAVALSFSGKVADGDEVRVTSDLSQLAEINARRKMLDVSLSFTARVGGKPRLFAKCGNSKAVCSAEYVCPAAVNQSTDEQEITRQLRKIGDFQYTITDIDIQIDDNFVPKSVLNGLRRQTFATLSENIVADYNKKLNRKKIEVPPLTREKPTAFPCKIIAVCTDLNSLTAAQYDGNVDVVVADFDELTEETLNSIAGLSQKKTYVDLPPFVDLDKLGEILPKNLGIAANNVGAAEFALRHNIPLGIGAGLNYFNSYCRKVFAHADFIIYSDELTLSECAEIPSDNAYKFVSGRLKLMKFVHCPYKEHLNHSCDTCKITQNALYTDESGNKFTIRRRKAFGCHFELLNGPPLCAGKNALKPFNYAMDYDAQTVKTYHEINCGKAPDITLPDNYTKGRLFSKVE